MTESPDNKQSKGRTNTLLSFAKNTYVVFLIIAACLAIRTFWPQRFSVPKTINVNIVDTKGKAKGLSAEGKAHFKEQLYMALMEVSEKAESAYNEKFVSLLTVLSIFGVAWPLILGLLQFRFNERELKKIDESVDKINDIEKTAKNAEAQANSAEEQANKAEGKIKDVEHKVEEAKEQANSASQTAQYLHMSTTEYQDIVYELADFKNNMYNDIPFVYQTLALYLHQVLTPPVPATGKALNDYLFYSTFALEMGLNALYYACMSDNKRVITDMQKRVLCHLNELDSFMKTNNVSENQQMSHLNSFSWDIIQNKVEPKVFSEIKNLYDKHFYKEGEKQ